MAHGPFSPEPDEPCQALGTDQASPLLSGQQDLAEDVFHEVFGLR